MNQIKLNYIAREPRGGNQNLDNGRVSFQPGSSARE